MASLNLVTLIGRLGKDPEIRSTQGGTTMARFSIATDEKFTDKSGQKQQRTDWHSIIAWGKLADICGTYLRKGKMVAIVGSIRYDKWEDKQSGQTKYRTDIVAQSMQMLDKRDSDDEGGSNTYQSLAQAPAAVDDDDEVPF